jgi:hypothetical protein
MTAVEMKDPKKEVAVVRVGICCSDCCIENAALNKNSKGSHARKEENPGGNWYQKMIHNTTSRGQSTDISQLYII